MTIERAVNTWRGLMRNDFVSVKAEIIGEGDESSSLLSHNPTSMHMKDGPKST
jgi:hypothetical protein